MTDEERKIIDEFRTKIENWFREHPNYQHLSCHAYLYDGKYIVCVDRDEYGRVQMIDSQAIHHDLDYYGPNLVMDIDRSLRENHPGLYE